MEEMSVKNAEDFKHYLIKGAPLGYKIYMRNLKAAFNKAVDWEMISSNPFAKIKISKTKRSPVEPQTGRASKVIKRTWMPHRPVMTQNVPPAGWVNVPRNKPLYPS